MSFALSVNKKSILQLDPFNNNIKIKEGFLSVNILK